jgi:hypothetical protein
MIRNRSCSIAGLVAETTRDHYAVPRLSRLLVDGRAGEWLRRGSCVMSRTGSEMTANEVRRTSWQT